LKSEAVDEARRYPETIQASRVEAYDKNIYTLTAHFVMHGLSKG